MHIHIGKRNKKTQKSNKKKPIFWISRYLGLLITGREVLGSDCVALRTRYVSLRARYVKMYK